MPALNSNIRDFTRDGISHTLPEKFQILDARVASMLIKTRDAYGSVAVLCVTFYILSLLTLDLIISFHLILD